MRRTLSILTALAGALILTILAAAPAQAATNARLNVNTDNGYVVFTGDSGVPNQEYVKACDTKNDGYAISAMVDIDGDGTSDVQVNTTIDSGDCFSVSQNIKTEDKPVTFWGCQVKLSNHVNCTDRVTVYA